MLLKAIIANFEFWFGMILTKLLTGEKAICVDINEQDLASLIASIMKNIGFFKIIDHNVGDVCFFGFLLKAICFQNLGFLVF